MNARRAPAKVGGIGASLRGTAPDTTEPDPVDELVAAEAYRGAQDSAAIYTAPAELTQGHCRWFDADQRRAWRSRMPS